MRRWIVSRAFILLVSLCVSGCANAIDSDSVRTALSQRERDSLLAGSALPGSRAVGRALDHSDVARKRAAALDSLTR
jgi:hypothetical protein